MNPIQAIARDIVSEMPGVSSKVRQPKNPEGQWWLDVESGDQAVTIQWSPRKGFGVSASMLGDGYGEGPEETFDSTKAVTKRVLDLLRTKAHTVPPPAVILQELRARLGMTQQQVAVRLGVQQAAVSRLERRDDMTLSSLRRFVAALGAELEINIRTPDGAQLRLSDGEAPPHRLACEHVVDRVALVGVGGCGSLIVEQLHRWHSEVEVTLRSRWPIRSKQLVPNEVQGTGLAWAEPEAGRVNVNFDRVRDLAQEIWGRNSKAAVWQSADQVFEAVSRHLLAHEIGHCVDRAALRAEPAFQELRSDELTAEAMAGWIAGNRGDPGMVGAALSSHLGCDQSACAHPSPVERSFAFVTGHVLGAQERSVPPAAVNLFVVRTSVLERSRAFYQNLGLDLQPEQHGEGPLHYSCQVAGTVLEIYPTSRPTGGLRLGLRLPMSQRIIDRLIACGELPERPVPVHRAPGPDVFVLRDPDGNAIELEAT